MANQYTVVYPYSTEELRDLYAVHGWTQAEIAEKYGLRQQTVGKHMRKAGITARVAAKRDQRGEKNSSWRGGRVLMATTPRTHGYTDGGYWYVYAPDHPNCKDGRYVAEHIKVATEAAGRPLGAGEHVHHIDLDKRNNDPTNLVITTNSQHARWHAQLSAVAAGLVATGVIQFSPESGYALAEEVIAP